MESGFFHITFPLTNPIQIFLLILLIILITPLLFRRIRVPGIVGLILSGMLVGPQGLNLLAPDVNFNVLSTIGILYLMFLMGLELDFQGFKSKLWHSIVFGASTFIIPFAFGFITFYYLLDYPLLSAILIANTFSTHTLISYPITSRLGINKIQAVTITIGATIITDTAVLILLTFIANLAIHVDHIKIGILITGLVFILFFSLYLLPRFTRWFLRVNKGDGHYHFIYVLTCFFTLGFICQIFGIEPIIGAFLAGLALNRLLPSSSILFNRINFFGNTIFIPIFLLGVGMIVNFQVFFDGWNAIWISIILVGIALFTKYLAAHFSGLLLGYPANERKLMFGLSSSHAAAILAVLLVGYQVNLIDDVILNGSLLLILVSCLVSSFVTESVGKKIAVSEAGKKSELQEMPEKILIPVSNPRSISGLLEFSNLIKDTDSKEPLFPLTIVPDDELALQSIRDNVEIILKTSDSIGIEKDKLEVVSRVDVNITHAIARAAKELMVSKIVIGWSDKLNTSSYLFGSLIENLVNRTDRMLVLASIQNKIHPGGRILVSVPNYAEFEIGFQEWIQTLGSFAWASRKKLHFAVGTSSISKIRQAIKRFKNPVELEFEIIQALPEPAELKKYLQPGDFIVQIAARHRTLSYHPYLENISRKLAREYPNHNILIIYPTQKQMDPDSLSSQLEGLSQNPIQENLDRIATIRKYFSTFMKRFSNSNRLKQV